MPCFAVANGKCKGKGTALNSVWEKIKQHEQSRVPSLETEWILGPGKCDNQLLSRFLYDSKVSRTSSDEPILSSHFITKEPGIRRNWF